MNDNYLSNKIQFMRNKAKYYDNLSKSYERKLNKEIMKESDEWMRIYHPSLNGFEEVLKMMKMCTMDTFEVLDPPKNYLINGFSYYLTEWMCKELNLNPLESEIILTNDDLTFDMKRIIKKYDIKNVNITIKIDSQRYISIFSLLD